MPQPDINDLRNWPIDQLRNQYLAEQAEHRQLLEAEQDDMRLKSRYYDRQLGRLYRLGYMKWLLNGAPQPMPLFV